MTLEAELDKHEQFMRVALQCALEAGERGEVPVGAVIVQGNDIIARGGNRRETWHDPVAHAEIIAIREASQQLGGWRLSGCTLYVTLEPCPMCAGAIMLSRLDQVVYGAVDTKGGAIESKVALLSPGLWNHQPRIAGGVLADECGMILKEFFRRRRSEPSTRPRRDV